MPIPETQPSFRPEGVSLEELAAMTPGASPAKPVAVSADAAPESPRHPSRREAEPGSEPGRDGGTQPVRPSLVMRLWRRPAHPLVRLCLTGAGGLLFVGFFLPWVRLGALSYLSGLQLVMSDAEVVRGAMSEAQRYILLGVPALGLGLVATGVAGIKGASQIGLAVAIATLAYGLFFFLYVFFNLTGIGLWLVLAGSTLALSTGLVATLRRARAAGRAQLR